MKNLVSDLDELHKLLCNRAEIFACCRLRHISCKINETLGDPARSEFITDNLP